MTSLTIKGLKEWTNQMKKARWELPIDAERFITVESKKLINNSKNASPYPTFKKRWFTKTKKVNQASIWKGIFNKAPHLHLVNNGHKQIGHKPDKKYHGYVEGQHFLDDVLEQFETQFYIDMEKFMNGVWRE
ncbi:MAG: hypothetical protein IJ790_00885 [Lachnospiraceae bacterium]|nr:hypothetical protein [Lachnospiraceae bacterium]